MKIELKKRGINYLYHFTNVKNIQSIMQYGLLNNEHMDENNIEYDYNDVIRNDGYNNAICLSIEWPNYKMFYQLRIQNPDEQWVVLQLDSSLLYKKKCAFSIQNAGCSIMREIPIENKMGVFSFQKLFEDYDEYPCRKDTRIPDCYPTNPQAEVSVFGNIEIDYITAVYFDNVKTYNDYKVYPHKSNYVCNCNYFFGRVDYEYW